MNPATATQKGDYTCLALSENGLGVSQFCYGKLGRHNGKKIPYDSLPENIIEAIIDGETDKTYEEILQLIEDESDDVSAQELYAYHEPEGLIEEITGLVYTITCFAKGD